MTSKMSLQLQGALEGVVSTELSAHINVARSYFRNIKLRTSLLLVGIVSTPYSRPVVDPLRYYYIHVASSEFLYIGTGLPAVGIFAFSRKYKNALQ